MTMLRVSVTIITRNRGHQLTRCLRSLLAQTVRPFEVLVVDNASVDNTQEVCKKYSYRLPLRWVREERVGIPFARNACLRQAHGEVIAFLDDDCTASSNWVDVIQKHFVSFPATVGVVGVTENATPRNVYACVEYAYYRRLLLRAAGGGYRPSRLTFIGLIDFKNAAYRRGFMRQFRFSSRVPYGDVGNEDVALGKILLATNKLIYLNPLLRVKHQFSRSLSRLAVRNFWVGFADRVLLDGFGLDLRVSAASAVTARWITDLWRQSRVLPSPWQRFYFGLLCLGYPLCSRAGRWLAWATRILSVPIRIPPRGQLILGRR